MAVKFTESSFLVEEVMAKFSYLIIWINSLYETKLCHLIRNRVPKHGVVTDTLRDRTPKKQFLYVKKRQILFL